MIELFDLPELFFGYLKELINAPIIFLLYLVDQLMSGPVDTYLFEGLWLLVIYILSIFYGVLILWAGFNFITSSNDPVKRDKAKTWLKNILIMVVLVQASYYLYDLILKISAGLTSGIFGMIDENFFYLYETGISGLGLDLAFGSVYLVVLLITAVLLSVRYFFVAVGLILFPIGIFFYFIDFLKSYGKLIINSLMILIFLPFFQSLILLIVSRLAEVGIFASVRILVMTTGFVIIDLMMIFLLIFALVKSALTLLNTDIGKATKMAVRGKI